MIWAEKLFTPAWSSRRAPGDLCAALAEVVGEFDDIRGKRSCLLGRTTCSDHTPCVAHHRWKSVAEKQAAFFRDTTVADLLRAG